MLKDVVNTITTEFRVSQKCDDYADPLENKFTSPIIHKLKKKTFLLLTFSLYWCKSDRPIDICHMQQERFGYKKFKDIRKV